MGKQFERGQYKAGTALRCTRDYFDDGEIFTEGNVYTIDKNGRLVDNAGDANDSTWSAFEEVPSV